MIDPTPTHGRYTLRPAQEADRDFVLTLWSESLGGYVAPLFGRWDEAQSHDSYIRKQATGLMIVLVDGAGVGVLHLSQDKDWLSLNEIELCPQYRNHGLGTRIIQDVLDHADANGLNVELQVLVTNPALRLYERMGFRPSHVKMFRPRAQ